MLRGSSAHSIIDRPSLSYKGENILKNENPSGKTEGEVQFLDLGPFGARFGP